MEKNVKFFPLFVMPVPNIEKAENIISNIRETAHNMFVSEGNVSPCIHFVSRGMWYYIPLWDISEEIIELCVEIYENVVSDGICLFFVKEEGNDRFLYEYVFLKGKWKKYKRDHMEETECKIESDPLLEEFSKIYHEKNSHYI